MDNISSGIPEFDTILGGGIPTQSCLMIVGEPGSGKTVLVQQIAFAQARAGRRVLYFSTLSEPHVKLLAHIENFGFYDSSLLVDRVRLYSLSTEIGDGDLTAARDTVMNAARIENADIIIIDGLHALEELSSNRGELRRFLYNLETRLNLLGKILLVTSEHDPDETAIHSNFTTVDGVIAFARITNGSRTLRKIEVRKLRGMNHMQGRHTYYINSDGLRIHPRFEALPHTLDFPNGEERLAFAIPELDEMLGGGLPTVSTTILAGSPGVGKTLLYLYYLQAGVRAGETGLLLTLRETRSQIVRLANAFNLDIEKHLDSGAIQFRRYVPSEISIDVVADDIRMLTRQKNIKRLAIDSRQELQQAADFEGRGESFFAALANDLGALGVTTCMTYEAARVIDGGSIDLRDLPLSTSIDNILLMRYFDGDHVLHRNLTILKMRNSVYDKRIRPYSFDTQAGLRFQDIPDTSTQA